MVSAVVDPLFWTKLLMSKFHFTFWLIYSRDRSFVSAIVSAKV